MSRREHDQRKLGMLNPADAAGLRLHWHGRYAVFHLQRQADGLQHLFFSLAAEDGAVLGSTSWRPLDCLMPPIRALQSGVSWGWRIRRAGAVLGEGTLKDVAGAWEMELSFQHERNRWRISSPIWQCQFSLLFARCAAQIDAATANPERPQ